MKTSLFSLHIVLVSVCFLATALAVQADEKKVREAILQIADLLEKKDVEGVKKKVKELRKNPSYDLAELMWLFEIRTKGGIGLWPKAAPFKPDGIELMIQTLDKKPLEAKELAARSEGLVRMAHVVTAIAHVTEEAMPSSRVLIRKKRMIWLQATETMREAARELAEGAQAQKADAVQKAARKLNNACISCHDLFRNAQVPTTFINELNDKTSTPAMRIDAIWAIARYEPSDAIPALLPALKDKDGTVRAELVRSLERLGVKKETRLEVLNESLQDASPFVRYWFAHHLRALGADEKKAVPVLVGLLKNPESAIRAKSAEVLGRIDADAQEAIPALKEAEKDADADVRRWVAFALKRLDRSETIPSLIQALKSGDALERGKAALALGKQGQAAVPLLLEVLGEKDRDVRGSAVFALGKIGPEARVAIPRLLDLLKEDDAYVRRMAGEALKKLDPQAASKAGVK